MEPTINSNCWPHVCDRTINLCCTHIISFTLSYLYSKLTFSIFAACIYYMLRHYHYFMSPRYKIYLFTIEVKFYALIDVKYHDNWLECFWSFLFLPNLDNSQVKLVVSAYISCESQHMRLEVANSGTACWLMDSAHLNPWAELSLFFSRAKQTRFMRPTSLLLAGSSSSHVYMSQRIEPCFWTQA